MKNGKKWIWTRVVWYRMQPLCHSINQTYFNFRFLQSLFFVLRLACIRGTSLSHRERSQKWRHQDSIVGSGQSEKCKMFKKDFFVASLPEGIEKKSRNFCPKKSFCERHFDHSPRNSQKFSFQFQNSDL